MQGVFKYKIYRQKFLLSSAVIVLLCAVLFLTAESFFIRGWANKQQLAAGSVFRQVEGDLQRAGEAVDSYMVRLYSNPRLLADLFALNDSRSLGGYMNNRQNISAGTNEEILSFPADAKRFWIGRADLVTGMSLRSGNSEKFFSLNYQKLFDESDLRFVQDAAVLSPRSLGGTMQFSRILYDPGQVTRKTGEIRFWLDAERLFQNRLPSTPGAYVLLGSAVSIELQSDSIENAALLSQVLAQPEDQGSFPTGLFSRVYYSRSLSSQLPSQIVSDVDSGTLRSAHRGTVLLLGFVFAVLALFAVGVLLINIHYDAKFLRRILGTIQNVRNGNFSTVSDSPVENRRNEYGMISDALDRMSVALGEYIRTEYQLKLRQQAAAMRALQHQINPHFLYNTLEDIRANALMCGDPSTAEAIALLGELYRNIVRGESVVTIAEELQLLEVYLRIMEMRYQGQFCYQLEVEPDMLALGTVKFWMQPLAENFFSHGFDRESEYNLLIVSGQRDAVSGTCRVDIIDNGSGLPSGSVESLNQAMRREEEDDSGASIGLHNVYMRLSYFYGEGFSMEIRNNTEGGACITLVLPDPPQPGIKKEGDGCIPY